MPVFCGRDGGVKADNQTDKQDAAVCLFVNTSAGEQLDSQTKVFRPKCTTLLGRDL